MVLQKIPEWFYGTPVGKKMQKEEQQKLTGERQEHIAAIDAARKQLAAESPALEKAVKKAVADFEIAHAALKAAEAVVARAKTARYKVVDKIERSIGRHEQALADTADPRIPEMVVKLHELHRHERRQHCAVQHEETGMYHEISGNPFVRVLTNAQARADRLHAICAAFSTVEEFRYSPNTDVAEEFKAILAKLPAADKMESIGVKERQEGDRDVSDSPRSWAHRWKDDPETVGSR